ncbi:hypothetical protein HDU76_003248 [Blyttiomyces sp. JEL0837]|nr:hypothetical protein HDU76_003248 [Blyttiomyces sp. JEL0837]
MALMMSMVYFNQHEVSDDIAHTVDGGVRLDKRVFEIGSPDMDEDVYDEDAELADLESPTGTVKDSVFAINVANWDDFVHVAFIPQLDVDSGISFPNLLKAFLYVRSRYFNQYIPIQIQDPAAGPDGFGTSPVELFQARRLPWLVPEGSNFKAVVSLSLLLWIFPEDGSQLSVPDFRHNRNFQASFYVAPVFRFQNRLLVLDPSINMATYMLASDWIKLIGGARYAALCDVQAAYPTSQCETVLQEWPTPIPFGPAREERFNLIINSLYRTYQTELDLETELYQHSVAGIDPYTAQQHAFGDIDHTIVCVSAVYAPVCADPTAATSVDVISGYGNAILGQPTPLNDKQMFEDSTHVAAWLSIENEEYTEECSLPPQVALPIPTAGFVNCPNGQPSCNYAVMEQHMINARRGDILVIVHAELECAQIPADGGSSSLEALLENGCAVINLNRVLVDGGPAYDATNKHSSFADLTKFVNHFQNLPITSDGIETNYFFSHVVITHIDLDHISGIVGLFKVLSGESVNKFEIAPLSQASTIFYFADPAGFLAPGTACPGGTDIYNKLVEGLPAFTVRTPEVDLTFATEYSLLTIHWIGPKKNQFNNWATYAAAACKKPSDDKARNALSIVFEATLSVRDYITDPHNPQYAPPFVSALYTGDMNIQAIRNYASITPSVFSGSYDYVKAPHHGSSTSWTKTNTPNIQNFFAAFTKIGKHLISAESRRYTHPTAEYIQSVYDAKPGTEIYLTNKMRDTEKIKLSAAAQAAVVEGVNNNPNIPVIYRSFFDGAVVPRI